MGYSGKQVAAGAGIAAVALLLASDEADAQAVLEGEQRPVMALRIAAQDLGSGVMADGVLSPGETPPPQHVAPEGSATPSDGDPTTTDPRDPGGSQTTTPDEQQHVEETSDSWEDAGLIDGDNEVESESGGSGPNIGSADDPENRLNDTDGDGEADSIDLRGLY